MQKLLNKILILFMFTILSGCASITESKNQSMSVTTGEVTGAMCTLSNSKGSYYVTTPGSVMVRNACDQLAISCTKEGYVPANPGAGTVQDKAKKMAWGNIVFGGIIGIAVDIIPTPKPEIIFVAEPVFDCSTIEVTGFVPVPV